MKLLNLRVRHLGLPTIGLAFKFNGLGYLILSLFYVSIALLSKTDLRIFVSP